MGGSGGWGGGGTAAMSAVLVEVSYLVGVSQVFCSFYGMNGYFGGTTHLSRHKDVLKTTYFWSQRRLRLVSNGNRDDFFLRRLQDVFQETS